MDNEPRHHHFVPQFYLRNFACDEARKKVTAVTKHDDRAVWMQRSIEYIGAKEDLYYHPAIHSKGALERAINRDIERPISESQTWRKIATGREELLDEDDMPVLYALIRHLELRTPHSLQTMRELIDLCEADPEGFSAEEREMYRELCDDPDLQFVMFGTMAGSVEGIWEAYPLALMSVCRTKVPLRTSSTPVFAIRAPDHPALHLPLPGQTPYTVTLSLSRFSFMTLTLGNFSSHHFINHEVSDEVARGYNRQRVAQFGHFPTNEHLITDHEYLIEDMVWAPYDVESQTADKIVFRRRPDRHSAAAT